MILPKIARIAVEQTAFHFDKLYDYTIPDRMGDVPCGSRVLVPFGGGNRRRQGIVLAYAESGEVAKLKPISAVLDAQPLLNDEMLAMVHWLKERTFCTYFDAVRAMLPSGLYMRIRPIYRVVEELPGEALSVLSPYPMIGLCGLSEFGGAFIGREFSPDVFQIALTQCCALAVALFGGFFLAAYLVDKIGRRWFNSFEILQ